MKTNNRFVVWTKASQTYVVYEGREPLATYIIDSEANVSKEEIEEVRTATYPPKRA